MIYDIQKASFSKRLSAYILDFILLVILITGVAWLLSVVFGYDSHLETIEQKRAFYSAQYSTEDFKIDFEISSTDYEKLTEEERKLLDQAYAEFSKDETVIKEYNVLYSLIVLMVSISVLVAHLILEFILPLILKNGQTVGKKIFGIAVVHSNCVRISHLTLFVRSILGKYTIETMIPVICTIMIIFTATGVSTFPVTTGLAIIFLLFAVQIAMLCASKNNTVIHDLISDTVAVDLSSQMIFKDKEALTKYIEEQHKKKVENSVY